ncbi:maleate cis-trans isomerase family protein [Texcoconibacillus texcoconensis]|uniref:Maleate cis-trans isomerase n=1 Tax=Texcoconibacillus texcoconensis TaxID=1095777 RepID=A0A840QQV2_9BACI|nr:maleate cis-trans isomerase [Texcoconibacillus texcoconensis]MBB5173745.1 maleate cis-trans isomerase [Texcoconibacillus texcoconensis]
MDRNADPVKVGFLYPGYAAEDDYPRLGQMVDQPVDVKLVHTTFDEDAHTVEALSEMGSTPRIIEGTKQLPGEGVHSVLWTSTSASFVLGLEGIKKQITTLENQLNVPASTTALAFIRAARAIGAERVAIAATYPKDVAMLFRRFLEQFDIEVIQYASRGIITAAEVGTLNKQEVLQWAVDNDCKDADALFIPDTALHSAAWIEDIETNIQKPVLTANQVSFWEALRLADGLKPQDGLGTLFKKEVPNLGGRLGDVESE